MLGSSSGTTFGASMHVLYSTAAPSLALPALQGREPEWTADSNLFFLRVSAFRESPILIS